MTVVKPRDVPGFLKNRPKQTILVLVHGPDQGLVRDRAQVIAKTVVDDLNDPFNAIELSDAILSENGRLSDEVAALSFMGGERLVRIRSGGSNVTAAVSLLLSGIADGRVQPNALVVIEGGELTKGNALRKACEASNHAGVIACYPDDARAVADTIRTMLEVEGLTIRDDAISLLSAQLGDDRGITRSVVEALILYKGPKGVAREDDVISIEDVRLCAVDSAADATFAVVDAALSGEPKALSLALYRAEMAAVSPIAILRITQGKLLRLLTVQAYIRDGESVANATKKIRPPVFFGERKTFERQLNFWPLKALELAVKDVLQADLAAKTTGAPQRELIERTLLRLSAMAVRRK